MIMTRLLLILIPLHLTTDANAISSNQKEWHKWIFHQSKPEISKINSIWILSSHGGFHGYGAPQKVITILKDQSGSAYSLPIGPAPKSVEEKLTVQSIQTSKEKLQVFLAAAEKFPRKDYQRKHVFDNIKYTVFKLKVFFDKKSNQHNYKIEKIVSFDHPKTSPMSQKGQKDHGHLYLEVLKKFEEIAPAN